MCFLPVGLKTPLQTSHLEEIHLSSSGCLYSPTGLVISSKGNETVLNFLTPGILYSRAHLRVGYLRGFLGQAAALCRNQVVVLGADVLV